MRVIKGQNRDSGKNGIGMTVIIWGVTQGLYWDNSKENGNHRDYRDSVGVI